MNNDVGIYRITSPSGKVYIGQSWDIKKRISYYNTVSCKSQKVLYNSLCKYGFSAHIFEVIHQLPPDCTQEILDMYEIFYIETYKNANIVLLNVKSGGKGGKHSEETKQLLRKINIGKKYPPRTNEIRNKISRSNKGKFKSATHVNNMRIAITKAYKDGILKKKFGESHHNCKLSNENMELIRTQYTNGSKQKDIAFKYNISSSYVSMIVNRKRRTNG